MVRPQSGFLSCLGEALILGLGSSPPAVRQTVEYLVSRNALARVLGVDGALEALGPYHSAEAAQAITPYVLALATAPSYPNAASLLARLDERADELFTEWPSHPGTLARPPLTSLFEAHAPALLHVARSSRDPEAARAAARLCSHLGVLEDELAPILQALLSGTPEPADRMRLFCALSRLELPVRGGHPRVVHALRLEAPIADAAAAALAVVRVLGSGAIASETCRAALERVGASAPHDLVLPSPIDDTLTPAAALAAAALEGSLDPEATHFFTKTRHAPPGAA